ncbi:PREDICTED: aldehyde dehydrogenase family 3 member I1, chloroplastic isoform X1 [Tarenaya hassleriana]|uniref:aldehyde dehydrogenase family 3 member I1, chloroplastic isoform X1 n=2 Tax=Tarenaya hassleriana TaxID=28532 RepID=UPI00053CA370|nr:PREDICTED: aldehyde dehydrogenase family 3 member I1, chloroplastic isoform X1 [Tarenaya hassleriana]XP_010547358.1 PREDICTED: aldehyde dehydrogenase family 3 member I1, chloroplastic isoform X1 [Tarenaya hassleriana]
MKSLSLSFSETLYHTRLTDVALADQPLLKSGGYGCKTLSCRYPSSLRFACCRATLSAVEKKESSSDGEETVASLVEELRDNFKTGKTKSYEWRITQLEGIARMIDEKSKYIAQALREDLNKPELEAFLAEISNTKSSCMLAIKELKNWMTPEPVTTSVTTSPSSAEIVSEPLGVVLIISAWNFPFLLAIDPVIGAIAAGNAVVLKPSEIAPATSSLLARLFREYLDGTTIRVVEGGVPETTTLLEQKWDKIFFTGGARVGRIVMSAAAKNLTPVVLELGGKCPAVVDSDVNLQVTARRIIAGKWACNNGQACIGVDYVITTKDFAPKLIEALKSELVTSFGENPLESKDISRIVSSFHFKRLESMLNESGVADKIVIGGQKNEEKLQISPTILLDVPEGSSMMQEEIFGPLLPIITVQKIEDGFEIIRSKPKPLAAYLFTNNELLKKKFVENISAGGMGINDAVLHVTVDGLPFGGVGESGMGGYHGKFSFETFSHKKGVLYRSFSWDSDLRYPPYTPKKQKVLTALLSGNLFDAILALF